MSRTAAADSDRGGIFDQAAYWLTIIAVYFLLGPLFFYAGKSKLLDDRAHAPPALKKQFAGTFIDTFPGVDIAWLIIGILEFAIFVLVVLSIVRGEFLPQRTKSLLFVALALALTDFACLSFGQTASGNSEGTALLYTYFGTTAVILLLVLRLPPNAPMRWLTARRQEDV